MNKSSRWFPLLVAFVMGCASSAALTMVPEMTVAPARAGAPQRWEYFCQNDIDDPWKPEGRSQLNRFGSQGWELVQQVVGGGMNDYVLCFKRPLP